MYSKTRVFGLRKIKLLLVASIAISLLFVISVSAETISDKLSGRILLQVEDKGQAWYIEPDSLARVFLGRPADAFRVMRELGLGISEENYTKFNGIAPERLAGKILLRVESYGEAYYVNPLDLSMYYLGRPSDAFSLMREFGLGISNQNLSEISVVSGFEEIDYLVSEISRVEEVIHEEEILEEVILEDELILDLTEKEFGTSSDIVLREVILGEVKKIQKTTVKASFPNVVVNDSHYGLLWWDGFAVFSKFNPDNLVLDRLHNFSGSSPGDLTQNSAGYAVAWEKNCQIYVDVVNELNNTLNDSKSIVSRIGEACPTNIRLSNDGANFSLLWTQGENMYLKIFTSKAVTINTEILISDMVDYSVRPAIIWDGEVYIVSWQEIDDQEKSIYVTTFDQSGQELDTKQKIFSGGEPIANLELLVEDDAYKLFYLENNVESSVIKSLTFSLEQINQAEINDIDTGMRVSDVSVLSVVGNNQFYGLSWESSNEQIYFTEIDRNNNLSSEISLVSSLATKASQADIFMINGKYGLFWHANDDLNKAVYFREID